VPERIPENMAVTLGGHKQSTLLNDLAAHYQIRTSSHFTSPTITAHRGTLEIRAEAQTNTRDLFVATFRGYKLANKDGFFGTSDPFLVISRYEYVLSFILLFCCC